MMNYKLERNKFMMILEETRKRYVSLKMSCDSCIPQEDIDFLDDVRMMLDEIASLKLDKLFLKKRINELEMERDKVLK